MKASRTLLATAILLSSFVVTPCISIAAVSQFVFSTSPQTIATDTLSEVITIQSQDSSGTKENIANTMYVTVTSSSATGQFFSNTSGNVLVVPVTMSKNSANKNFYYKDTTAGTYTIHVDVTDVKGSPALFGVDQNITIGGSGSPTTDTSTTTTPTTEDTTSSDTPSASGSAHSSPAPLGNTEQKIEFEISAGRDRLTIVGNTLGFRVVPVRTQGVSEQGIVYQWSFGDGTIDVGNLPTHTYRFPGDYAVVVNGSYADKQAVSRLQVKVVAPNIFLSLVSGGVEITNKSGVEINLEGWSLVGGNPSTRAEHGTGQGKTFIFPTDTLIPNGKKVTFANEVIGMDTNAVQLLNPMHREIARVDALPAQAGEVVPVLEVATPGNLQDLQAKLDEARTKLAQISPKSPASSRVARVARVVSESKLVLEVASSTPVNTENTALVFEAPAQTGIITSIFSLPMRGFNFIKHLFVEE